MIKKICLWALLGGMSFLGACTNEELVEMEVLSQEEGLSSFEAGFVVSDGRTALEEGGKVVWEAGDEVVLFDDASSARYVALASGSTTMFVLKDGEKALNHTGTYTAFYPADAYNVATRSFAVKQVQKAVAGTFDPGAALCMATVNGREHASFKNLCSLLKVNAPQAAIDGKTTALNLAAPVSIVSGGTIASDGTLNWNQTLKNYRLEGNFEYGKDYYLAIPPQNFTKGFTLSFNNSSNATIKNCARTQSSAVAFTASKNYAMGTIFEVQVDNSWYEEVLEATPEATEFEVSTPEQFVSFVQMMNGLQTRSASGVDFEGKTIFLESDLDFTYYNDAISPIKNFKGSFDGQGHVIKNLKIVSDKQFVGLFATLEKNQTIQNLTLQGGKVISNYMQAGEGYLGALLGYSLGGYVINCHNQGCEVLGRGPNNVSGVVGAVATNGQGAIMACSNSGSVTSSVEKQVFLGGISGCWAAQASFVACYNVGTIQMEKGTQWCHSGGIVSEFRNENFMYGCFNSGSVLGVGNKGSLIGTTNNTAYVYNSCYADGEKLSDVGYNYWGGANKYNVSRCSYADAVATLNVGIEYYNKTATVPCEYRFVSGSKPVLKKVNPDDEGIGTPGLGEGEIF